MEEHPVLPQFSTVDTCANPDCRAEFRRLGEGKLSVIPIEDGKLWGLPADTKQKVVWLCSRCSLSFYVRADHRNHVIRVVHKARRSATA